MTRAAALTAAICLAAIPAGAQAHLVASGMGPIYDGITHFGLSPEDFLPVIALGLYVGLKSPAHARAALAGVTFGWALGAAAALGGLALAPIALSAATALLYLALGGLLAANRALPASAVAAFAATLGLVRGAADLAGVSLSTGHALSVVGMAAAVFAALALAASVTLPARRTWMVVAARVSGSWLAALGLLFAGWLLRFGAAAQ